MNRLFQLVVRVFLIAVVPAIASRVARASEDSIGCVKELSLPSSEKLVANTFFPETIKIEVEIGSGGKAKSVKYSTRDEAIRTELDGYFAKKTTYADACEGRTITFVISYRFQKDFTADTDVRFAPPDRIVIIQRTSASFEVDTGREYTIEKKNE